MKFLITETQSKRLFSEQEKPVKKVPKEWEPNSDCVIEFKKNYNQALQFWFNWLNNPETLKKYSKNYNISIQEGKSWFEKYKQALNTTRLEFPNYQQYIDHGNYGVGAYVLRTDKENIVYCNCTFEAEWENIDKLQILIHELQHILNKIKPFNPYKKITKVIPKIKQTNNDTDFDEILSNKQYSDGTYSEEKYLDIDKIKNIDQAKKAWKYLFNSGQKKSSIPEKYYCDDNENMSRIMSMRQLFNLSPNDKLTYEMIEPYIMLKKRDINISLFLLCWVNQGFPDINNMLNRLNKLAMTKTQDLNYPST